MKKRLLLLLGLCLLFSIFAAAAEQETPPPFVGRWQFAGGAEVMGYGFEFYEGSQLVLLNTSCPVSFPPEPLFPKSDDVFFWQLDKETPMNPYSSGEMTCYVLSISQDTFIQKITVEYYPDGRLHIPGGEGGGFYQKYEKSLGVPSLTGIKGNFPKNKTYPVYQGPGASYGVAAKGKAKVSTNGDIFCYGTFNDFLLISYDISKDKSRFGWIEASALENPLEELKGFYFKGYNLGDSYLYGVITQDVVMTDDPLNSKAKIASFKKGATVHCCAQLTDYMLVETYVGQRLLMGFVPKIAVNYEHGVADDVKCQFTPNAVHTQKDFDDAVEVLKQAIYDEFPGCYLWSAHYLADENLNPNAWWKPENIPELSHFTDGMKLYTDLGSISFTDYEIADYDGIAEDYGFILYKNEQSGWLVGNWGYE